MENVVFCCSQSSCVISQELNFFLCFINFAILPPPLPACPAKHTCNGIVATLCEQHVIDNACVVVGGDDRHMMRPSLRFEKEEFHDKSSKTRYFTVLFRTAVKPKEQNS